MTISGPIIRRQDSGYDVHLNGSIYGPIFRDPAPTDLVTWDEIEAYLAEHPEDLVDEPARQAGELETAARNIRDGLLSASDFHMLPDAPGDVAAWTAYRAALRAWPEAGTGFPNLETIPQEPEE